MQHLVRTALLIIFTLLCCSGTHSQNAFLPHFYNFDANDGLSHSVINHVFQDSEGFIWIATHAGLDRYCGYTFKHWTLEQLFLDGFSLESIGQDDSGWIWLKGYDGYDNWKLVFFNPKSEEIERPEQRFPGGIPLIFQKSQPGRWATNFKTDLTATNHYGKMFFGAVSKPIRLVTYHSSEGFKIYDIKELDQLIVKFVDQAGTIWGAEHGDLINLDSTGHILARYPNAEYNSISWIQHVHDKFYYYAYNFPPKKEESGQLFKLGRDGLREKVFNSGYKGVEDGFIYNPHLDVFLFQEHSGTDKYIHIISPSDDCTIQKIKDETWSSSLPYI
ncbi:MAG: two-component regulator propeller domain-containing protein, partial [Saprospiraceae bacterium]